VPDLAAGVPPEQPGAGLRSISQSWEDVRGRVVDPVIQRAGIPGRRVPMSKVEWWPSSGRPERFFDRAVPAHRATHVPLPYSSSPFD